MTKFFIIAGESSGDLLGGELIKELKNSAPWAWLLNKNITLKQDEITTRKIGLNYRSL